MRKQIGMWILIPFSAPKCHCHVQKCYLHPHLRPVPQCLHLLLPVDSHVPVPNVLGLQQETPSLGASLSFGVREPSSAQM